MLIAVCLIAALLLALWSGSLYIGYLAMESAVALPWAEFAARVSAWVPPAWMAGPWEDNLHLIVPALQALHPMLVAVSGWFALALWIVWLVGTLGLGLLTLLICIIIIAMRKDDARHVATPKAEPS